MIHYAALGEERTACDRVCSAPSEEQHTTAYRVAGTDLFGYRDATLDPRRVNCPTCIANMPEVPLCACGAPALYGGGATVRHAGVVDARPALHCAEHCPDDCRCQQCNKPLLDAAESFCQGCLDATDEDNGHDGITEYSDPAGVGGATAY